MHTGLRTESPPPEEPTTKPQHDTAMSSTPRVQREGPKGDRSPTGRSFCILTLLVMVHHLGRSTSHSAFDIYFGVGVRASAAGAGHRPHLVTVLRQALSTQLLMRKMSQVKVTFSLINYIEATWHNGCGDPCPRGSRRCVRFPAARACSATRWPSSNGSNIMGRGPRLVNIYGITETTVHVPLPDDNREDLASARSVIGRALPSISSFTCSIRISNRCRSALGEVYVGGAGMAQGYLNRSELTAERFVPDPFGPAPALASTLGRSRTISAKRRPRVPRPHRSAGEARGFRIELGEIEAAFVSEPHVAQASRDFTGGGVWREAPFAYVVPTPAANCTARACAKLRRRSCPTTWSHLTLCVSSDAAYLER